MTSNNERPICHRAEDLVAYLYNEASEADARDFADHAARCDACRSELQSFRRMHESIMSWRNEALGASFSPVAQSTVNAAPPVNSRAVVRRAQKLSALQALREFFTVSPLWLRGASAFAALLLCVLGVMMIMRWSQKPADIANNGAKERMYTGEEVKNAVKVAVEKKVQELAANNQSSSQPTIVKETPTRWRDRVQLAANQSRNTRSRLSRQEREQLAADLRLTLPAEEEEMLLALPEQDHPNQ